MSRKEALDVLMRYKERVRTWPETWGKRYPATTQDFYSLLSAASVLSGPVMLPVKAKIVTQCAVCNEPAVGGWVDQEGEFTCNVCLPVKEVL